ncbi:aminoglycoside phosphotransferase [Paenibacillus sp. J45TS6]|uniref:phosphotransferase family protein n=1 Tax=unclassified Paenibacillus TaxID=185978 RepID=UPI001B000DCA|nr:aminoglycoside phosphotransferase family protein [Paenibacillus sp. J45TS6]GIP44605.1 aminoglycoside phosphotransferase [Paenibacillus sp. J45TS6]
MIGKFIATGSSCEVYEWDGDDKVVKLFHVNTPLKSVQLEYNKSSVAWKSGLPVPRPFEQVIWEGRHGIVFEKIVGETLVNRIFERLYTFQKVDNELRLFARLLNDIHKTITHDIETDQKKNLKTIIGHPALFTKEEIRAIHEYLDRLPAKRQLCQGDTNLSNLILRDGDNKPVMIDWMHASLGNPAADVAEVCVIIEYAVLPLETPAAVDMFFRTSRQEAYHIFMDEYCKLSGVTEEEIRSWYVPAAARSIASGALPNEQVARLATMIRNMLANSLREI